MSVFRLENTVQRYDWGSKDAIPAFLGLDNPEGEPWAELWMGAHPKAPSIAVDAATGSRVGLDQRILADPEGMLGPGIAERYERSLPFLFKVLSAARPLSIQAHPNKLKAERGFDAEDRAGTPIDAAERNYRDRNHKPETVVAYTPFDALCGFRTPDKIIEDLKLIAPREWRSLAGRLAERPGKLEMSVFFYSLVSQQSERKARSLGFAGARIVRISRDPGLSAERRLSFRWVSTLLDMFPGDMGALAPLALNLIRLEPGQALDLKAGQPHAYLSGTAFEIMANSDNVLRGGLTTKHVDIPEFISALDFGGGEVCPVSAEPDGEGFLRYPSKAAEYTLRRAALRGTPLRSTMSGSPHIVLCVDGEATLEGAGAALARLKKGESTFISADEPEYRFAGSGELLVASVPL